MRHASGRSRRSATSPLRPGRAPPSCRGTGRLSAWSVGSIRRTCTAPGAAGRKLSSQHRRRPHPNSTANRARANSFPDSCEIAEDHRRGSCSGQGGTRLRRRLRGRRLQVARDHPRRVRGVSYIGRKHPCEAAPQAIPRPQAQIYKDVRPGQRPRNSQHRFGRVVDQRGEASLRRRRRSPLRERSARWSRASVGPQLDLCLPCRRGARRSAAAEPVRTQLSLCPCSSLWRDGLLGHVWQRPS